jgi:glycosyltransferase involved in cell wall biosynthesis
VPLALERYLRLQRPDFLLSAMWPLTVLAPLGRVLSGHRCKLLVSEHAILSAQYRSWGKLHRLALRVSTAIGYRMADARVGVSAGVVSDIACLAKMPTTDFHAIHNPLASRPPPSADAQTSANNLWAVPPGARVLTVGSFKAVKDHPLLMRAFAGMHQPNARLMFVGTGAGEVSLRALALDLGVSDRVIFAGFQPDPTPFYQSADLFVLSSEHEGFGNVIVEALACGLPVVSTDCPSGPSEILEHGKYGRLVPVGDAAALVHAIQATLADPGDPALRKRRAADFAPEIAARRYLDLLATR